MARKKKQSKKIKLDFTNVGKAFEPGEEYLVKIDEVTLEEGNKAPYFNIKLRGATEDYENSLMWHRASTSESSLWRLRPFLEAFGVDVPEGPLEIDIEDLVGREAMCSTFLDRYEGGSSIKPDEFWPAEESDDEDDDEKGDGDGDDEFDLDDLSDDEIMKLGEALKVKGKTAKTVKKKLSNMDEEDVAAAAKKLESGGGSSEGVSSDDVGEMSEDELNELIEEHDLEVDLSDYKTLKKKRNAVLDALEEEDLLDDD